MSETLLCDNCGQVAATDGLVGWVEVQSIGIDMVQFGQPTGPLHYCTPKCLAEAAAKKAGASE